MNSTCNLRVCYRDSGYAYTTSYILGTEIFFTDLHLVVKRHYCPDSPVFIPKKDINWVQILPRGEFVFFSNGAML